MTQSFEPKRVVKSYDQQYQAPPAKVFPLLCPVREYDWLEVWQCAMVWSDSGVAENNCIFTTDFPDAGREVWVVCRYEPPQAIEFVRYAGADKVTRLNIHLTDNGDGTTLARWTHIHTGLTPAGNAAIDTLSDARYTSEMQMLEAMLNHYLTTGSMLKGVARHYRQGPETHADH